MNGGLPALALLKLLRGMGRRNLKVTEEASEAHFQAGAREFLLKKVDDGSLPFKDPMAAEWKPFPREVREAVEIGRGWIDRCGSGKSQQALIRIAPDGLILGNGEHATFVTMDTTFPKECYVLNESFRKVLDSDPRHFAMGNGVIHFKCSGGLRISCSVARVQIFESTTISRKFKGYLVQFPDPARAATERAALMAKNNVNGVQTMVEVLLTKNVMKICGRNEGRWYEEDLEVEYRGPEMRFAINPDILRWIISEHTEALVSPKARMLKVVRADWEYCFRLKFL
jgi:hypothetical protein